MLNFVLSENKGIFIQKENRENYITELVSDYNKFFKDKKSDMSIRVTTEELMIDCFRLAVSKGVEQCKCYYSEVDFEYFKNREIQQ